MSSGGKFLHSHPALRGSEVENSAIFPFDFAQGHLQSEPSLGSHPKELREKNYGDKPHTFFLWCRGRESNPHSLRNTILSRARLPIPPPRLLVARGLHYLANRFAVGSVCFVLAPLRPPRRNSRTHLRNFSLHSKFLFVLNYPIFAGLKTCYLVVL